MDIRSLSVLSILNLFLKILSYFENCNGFQVMNKLIKHGGARLGAGRKKTSEETQVIQPHSKLLYR